LLAEANRTGIAGVREAQPVARGADVIRVAHPQTVSSASSHSDMGPDVAAVVR
jgi:hypothetical protein